MHGSNGPPPQICDFIWSNPRDEEIRELQTYRTTRREINSEQFYTDTALGSRLRYYLERKKMKIAQIAPLMESVPPRLYGGSERIVSYHHG
jgi:hypothetical protein